MVDDLYKEILNLRSSGQRAALATVVSTRGSSPGKTAMKLLIREDGTAVGTVGGGCVEADVYDAAIEVMRDEEARFLEFSLTEKGLPGGGLVCGGTVRVFVEPIVNKTLLLFGAGHVSRALSRVAAVAGFSVIVLDDRESFASEERFPDATRVQVVPDFGDVLDHVQLTQDTFGVIVTRGHDHDELVLRQVLGKPLGYLGMIGSRAKIKKLFGQMEKEGIEKANLEFVHAPIGLDIGAQTPEEIAVAVVAEMIMVRRMGEAKGSGRIAGSLCPMREQEEQVSESAPARSGASDV